MNGKTGAPPNNKDDPREVSESDKTEPIPEFVKRLYKENEKKKEKVSPRDPFKVKKSALKATLPDSFLPKTKPKNADQIVPVTRKPPREKNQFGQYIFPKPKEKKEPKPPPYKERDCEEIEKLKKAKIAKETKEKEKETLERLRKIANAPSIDPLFEPERSARQLRARKKLKLLLEQSEAEKVQEIVTTENNDEAQQEIELNKQEEAKEKLNIPKITESEQTNQAIE